MGTTQKILWGTLVTPTITLNNKGNGVIQACTFIDNSAVYAKRGKWYITYKTGSTGITATSSIKFYVYGSNGNTTYTNGVDGTDLIATSLFSASDVKWIELANVASTSFNFILDTELLWRGWLPKRHGIAIGNNTGGTSDTTAGNFNVAFLPDFDDTP